MAALVTVKKPVYFTKFNSPRQKQPMLLFNRDFHLELWKAHWTPAFSSISTHLLGSNLFVQLKKQKDVLEPRWLLNLRFTNFIIIYYSLIFQVFEGPVKKKQIHFQELLWLLQLRCNNCVLISLDNKDFSQHACEGFLN